MPIELDPDVIDTHAPVLYALAEQLQQEAEDALFITSAVEQLLHVAGIQALIRALMCEVASLITAVRLTVNDETSDAEN